MIYCVFIILFFVILIIMIIDFYWNSKRNNIKKEIKNKKIDMNENILSITEDLISYKTWDAIQENVLTRYASFQSQIPLVDNEKSLQKIRDIDNAFQIMIDLKRDKIKSGQDEYIDARNNLIKLTDKFYKRF